MTTTSQKTDICFINKPVEVTAMRFTDQFDIIPRRIEVDGHTYSFTEKGRQVLLRSGEELIRLLDISDGSAQFRLRQNSRDESWRLLTISR